MNAIFISLMIPVNETMKIDGKAIKPIEEVTSFIQSELIKGLELCGCKFNIYNKIHVGNYPKKCDVLLFPTSVIQTESGKCTNVGFLNITSLDRLTFYFKTKKLIKKRLVLKQDDAVICYAITDYNLKLLKLIKKHNKSITTAIVIPDLPEYMHAKNEVGIKKLIRKHYLLYMNRLMEKCKDSIDLFILFSKPMAEKIGCKDRYIVMEGVAKNENNNFMCHPSTKITSKRTIFYGGGVSEEYGVKRLVDAFMMTDDENYELIICGNGNAVEYVEQMALIDNRIHYAGVVSYQLAQEMLINSDIVVNPRLDGKYEFTKYSFPSKILDTLSLGKPLISYKLEGIPVDYYEYLIFVEDHKIESLKNKIDEVCHWTQRELEEFGKKGQQFVKENKNGCVQGRAIYQELLKNTVAK